MFGQQRVVRPQASYPLYAGRWVHLAATMRQTIYGGQVLEIWVDGALRASANAGSFTVAWSNNDLEIGRDPYSNKVVHGAIDAFRLDASPLDADGVKGAMRFPGGANNVLAPRGIFYESELYGEMNGSWSDLAPDSPLRDMNLYANDNNASAWLNGRPVHMVLQKNLTLAEAARFLDRLLTNASGNVTSFALRVSGSATTFFGYDFADMWGYGDILEEYGAIGQDPIGLRGGINRYNYVGANPVNRVDPSGENVWNDICDIACKLCYCVVIVCFEPWNALSCKECERGIGAGLCFGGGSVPCGGGGGVRRGPCYR